MSQTEPIQDEGAEKTAAAAAPSEAPAANEAEVGKGEATAAEPAAAPEPEPDPEPEPVKVTRQRQWVTLRGTSMDARVGAGLLADMAHDIRSIVGRPKACAIAFEKDAPAECVETLRRGLTDQGFFVHLIDLKAEDEPTVEDAVAFMGSLAEAGITSDDLVVAVGNHAALSVAAFVCPVWCAGVPLVEVPLTLRAAVLSGATPRALSVDGHPAMAGSDAQTRLCICDLDLVCAADNPADDVLLARALMASTAMCDCEKAVSRLWDRVDDIVSGDPNVLVEQLAETIKSRGKVVASSSLAIRQSIGYGQVVFSAARGLLPAEVPNSVILADALRFSARLSVAMEDLDIDDMFTQDELLENLGLGSFEAAIDADALVDAVRAECFARSNRMMLPLPRALGRVRLAAVDDDLLREHAAAWCAAHAPQA